MATDDYGAPITNEVPDDTDTTLSTVQNGGEKANTEENEPPQNVQAQVNAIKKKIRADKKHHEKAFKRMKRDMFVAMHGREEDWSEKNYKANIAGQHVKQKTATLYAKNPKATASRTERLDFAVWDEDPQSLMQALQTLQQDAVAQAAHAQAQAAAMAAAPPSPIHTAVMGHNGGPPLDDAAMQPYQPSPEAQQASALLADFQQGMEYRKLLDRVGKTMELLYARALREQKPVDFKTAAKQLVRRTCTTSVGYIELGFQREYGPRPGLEDHMADARTRLDHLRVLAEKAQAGEIEEYDAEMAELQESMTALQNEPEILIREGLVFDYPRSTKVIPDMLTKTLVGFVGARHVTIEYEYTPTEIRELFDVDLSQCANYTAEGKTVGEVAGALFDEDGERTSTKPGEGLCRVWKHYDKPSGLCYYLADGYNAFLREPAPPDVFVEDFWPVYALTFNEVESEDELFPPSDVSLILDMQNELNRSRQGKREHREAARPRWVFPNGLFEDEDVDRLKKMKPFDAIGLNVDPATDMSKALQRIPVPGVDPNLYDTGEVFGDAQLAVGAQAAQLGATSSATATESAIAAGTTNNSDGSSVDDLDGFMTVIARAAGQILLREMSEETVKAQLGPGAVWPHMSLADIANEVFLEIEAGSMGKPNQAIEVKNWQNMLPFLIQMPGIKPIWLAKETLRRLDDKLDLTDALVDGLPSIAQLNQMAQPEAVGAQDNPAAQGGKGGQNAPKPAAEKPAGSDAPMGNNRV
ncbi:hypothetical protein [Bradyrhizobium sp. 33ap4]|uniref:hypothetical protein n=1 Tax=Bradyrhizobium sp. 33ap4 TaxID=3061630 RepID=UPI00292E2EEC|nr:hypothetical protein [Bradyrhizobium sp. 33ap4]